ncbi:hypothetical protein EVAR_101375_1, partial [Eumeta japonica]
MTVIVAHVICVAISNVYPLALCGTGATCSTVNNHRAVCECPKGYYWSPFTECRPECYGDSDCPAGRPACFYGICKNTCDADLCEPNPCGTNAICIPGHDNTGRERPVCNCLPGHTGNPLTHCSRGECLSNSECPDNKACINYQCVNPCIGKCGSGAECEPKAHLSVCKCPRGTS